jgi:hypothetical protein
LLTDIQRFMAVRFAVSAFLSSVISSLLLSLATLCVFVVFRIVLRNQIAAMAVCVAFMFMGIGPNYGYASAVVFGIGFFYALMRFGFIAAFVLQLTATIIVALTLNTSAWYSHASFAALAIFAAIVLYAFRYSLGGRPLFAPSRLDD